MPLQAAVQLNVMPAPSSPRAASSIHASQDNISVAVVVVVGTVDVHGNVDDVTVVVPVEKMILNSTLYQYL